MAYDDWGGDTEGYWTGGAPSWGEGISPVGYVPDTGFTFDEMRNNRLSGQDYNFGGGWGDSEAQMYGGQDVMNLSPNDPASAYYGGSTPASYSYEGWGTPEPSGGGYAYRASDIYSPASYGAPKGGSFTDNVMTSGDLLDAWNKGATLGGSVPSGMGGGGAPGGGFRPSGGGGSYTPQPMQRISLGAPERTLYDRYKSMLTNPEQLESDPAYKFLFKQGEDALRRTLAAKRLTYSGKALNDTMAYGAGQAAAGFKSLMPEYRAGAQEELRRFMGPASLLPGYTSLNNAASQSEGSAAAMRELMPLYAQGGGGGGEGGYDPGMLTIPSGIGYGGVDSGYTPSYSRRLGPQELSFLSGGEGGPSGPQDIPELMDEMWG